MHSVRRDTCTHRCCRSLVFFASLLVRSRVEGNEENKVGAESRTTGECGELLTSTRSHMREGRKELVSIIIIRGVIHKTYPPISVTA